MSNQAKYDSLRETFESFCYQDFHYSVENGEFFASFDFVLSPYCRFDRSEAERRNLKKIEFHPCFRIPSRQFYHWDSIPKPLLDNLIFHIGMIELISYWKIACPKKVIVKPFALDEKQIRWWKKLYFNGLGEFFYQNKIQTSEDDFMSFSFVQDSPSASALKYPHVDDSQRVIVTIGGGKDSVVTLEALRKERQVIPFIINPRGATVDCACIAGFPAEEDRVVLQREIDPQLLELNKQGFLNGHTPFSAMLSFYTLLVSYGTATRDVALSNESSANEPTIPGTKINHQYSKSLEYEEDFRWYVCTFLNDSNHYYSYLRPYTELQIAEMFARHPQYFPVFKSCNAGSKENKWCCNCSKCLFAYIILSPFIDNDTMVGIFGEDLLDKAELQQYFDELCGIAPNKPFECVGTIDEVNKALRMIQETRKDKFLIRHYLKEDQR